MSAAASTEARELELVGKVELRIALAKDDKLETLLKTYLPPLLLKLGSEHVAVRNKVISTCQHIKIRLGGNDGVVLPVGALLKQYKESLDVPMIRHFNLLFIQQSIRKLSSQEQLDLLPVLLHGLADDAGKPTGATVFNLFLRLLPRLRLPPRGSKEDEELRNKLGLDIRIDDAKFVASWFSRLILLNINRSEPTPTEVRNLPQGLTLEQYNFLTLNGKMETWDPNSAEGLNLSDTKVSVLSFLSSGAFEDSERFMAALFAAADPNSRISSIGEDLLKRTTISLEDTALVSDLYTIYFSSKPALQIRILSLLSKSTVATAFPQKILGVVEASVQPGALVLKGLEALKLRNAMFSFLNWVSRAGSTSDLEQIAPSMVIFLRRYIEEQGWPVPMDRSSDQMSLRALAYETIGSMAKTVPAIAREQDLNLVRWLFRSLTEEKSSDIIFISIEGALASLLNAFAEPLSQSIREELRSLLLTYMTQEDDEDVVRSARFAAVRWANRCLDYSDLVGRWIDLLAVGGRMNENGEVVEEGNKGLDPYWYQLTNSSTRLTSFSLPDWTELVKVLFTGHSLLENSSISNAMRTGMEVDSVSVFGNFSGSKISAFSHAISYCRRMLLLRALERADASLESDADWERQLDVLLRTDKASRDVIKKHMQKLDVDVLSLFLSAAFEGMLWNDGNGLQDCNKSFVELGALAPRAAIGKLASRAEELLPAIRSNKVATRFFAAQAFGMTASHPQTNGPHLATMIRLLLEAITSWETAVGAEVNKVHGSLVALGYLISRGVYYGRLGVMDDSLIQDVILAMLNILSKARDATNKEAAMVAVAQLSAAGLFTDARIRLASYDTATIIQILAEDAKKGNEKSISALGRFSLVFDDDSEATEGPLQTIIGELYALHELRQGELHFTIGEALACAAAGWESECLVLSLDVDTPYKGRTKRPTILRVMMEKLLADCKNTKPSLKKASGIWLFCLIQHCGHLDEVQSRLRDCQAAFMSLLSARDDFVQETASRGLSLVYEQGDKELKDRLVADLVASFTGTSTKIKVDEETELFEPGALPTGDGKSVTSYKDIMSLAAEVGDQSLVYKFMSLASNAATWSTRAAFGRFGLSNILSESEVDPKLYPKLYRYRFDPNPNVQRSMNDIWNALIKNPTAIIEEHFDAIMDDLLKSILGKEWRTRQASCAAVADLVQSSRYEKYEKYLSQIWEAAFKVLDDIKGSVRKTAEGLCKVLAGVLVRQLEEGVSSKNAQAGLREVMPFLFSTRGLESPAKEVQNFAYSTVLKLIKSGGKNLTPFVPNLVEQILGLLSTLEPDVINYIHLNAAKYDTTEEEIDEARSRWVSHSPMMEAVERCLDLLDDQTMELLVPRLENVIKTAVGMPSKVGCSGVLASLATRHSQVFKPHADMFLKNLEKAVLDRNSTVSAAYARAAGCVARLAYDQQILKVITYSKNLYYGAEDETRRQISADIIYAISKFATDRFNSLAADILPFVFMAKHDFDEHVNERFKKTWDENVGGSRAILLYLKEILTLSSESLDSAKWNIKHTAALAIAEVVKPAGPEISLANAQLIWPSLEKALALKTFEGKEKILEAFVEFTKSAKILWNAEATIATQMKKIAIREAKRNNDGYRPYAFAALGSYAEARTDMDMFEEVYSIIGPHIEDLVDENRMDISQDDDANADNKSKDTDTATLTAGITAIFLAINTSIPSPTPLSHLSTLLTLMTKIITSPKSTILAKTAFYEQSTALHSALATRTSSLPSPESPLALKTLILLELPSGIGSEAVRQKRADAANALVRALKAGVFGKWTRDKESIMAELVECIVGDLRLAMKDERSVAVKSVLQTVLWRLTR